MRPTRGCQAPAIDGGVALVTGASAGIGRAICRLLAPRVKALVLVARRRERLEALASELRAQRPALVVDVQVCDLGDLDAVDRMLAAVAEAVGDVDVLVNNAGFGVIAPFERCDWTKMHQMIRVNVLALTYLTNRLLGSMVARRRGGILNISSGFGLTFTPLAAVYIGTKHFVTGFSESLRLDLRELGVCVTQVCPGPVDTEFESVAGNPTGQKVPKILEISAEHCARTAVRSFERGRALVVPGFVAWLVMGMGRITPRWLLRLVFAGIAGRIRRRGEAATGPEGPSPPDSRS